MNLHITEWPMAEALPIIRRTMAGDHWEEVPFGIWQMELDLDDDKYVMLEDASHAKVLIAFDDDQPIGYVSLISDTMLHHKERVQCTAESFYVDPAYRDKGVFSQLVKEAERICQENAIQFMSWGINPAFQDWKELQFALANRGYYITELTMTKQVT